MPVPPNEVLFTLDGEPWRLSGVCFVVGVVMFVVGLAAILVVLWRHGKVRSLSRSEAASVAMHAGESSSVDRAVAFGGPAWGKAWEYKMSIGDLRVAWHAKNYKKFFGFPAMTFCWFSFPAVLCFAASVRYRNWPIFMLGGGFGLLMDAALLFMMWAAIYTKLE